MIPFSKTLSNIIKIFPKYSLRICSSILKHASTSINTLRFNIGELNIFGYKLSNFELKKINDYEKMQTLNYRILHEKGHQQNYFTRNLENSLESIINIMISPKLLSKFQMKLVN